tara:strand:+ start:116 stop:508 length:393 start_codon:yes stop_codon:yes gene_type:complete
VDDYNSFLKQSLNLKQIRDERNKEVSKDSLFQSSKKKVQTTMIGALSTIEQSFGFLWGFDVEDESKLTEEQIHLKKIYDDARAKILDRGNTQIRNLELEFANYDIVRKKHFINLPVVNSTKQQTGDKNDG